MPKRRNRGQRGTREARHLSPESKAAGAGDADLRLRSDEGDAVRGILDQELNPFTLVQYTSQYRGILEARRKLPLFAQMDRFLDMFNKNQIIIVVGETGCGKTTQVPQLVALSDLPHNKSKITACTQPRRLTAMSAAKRVAKEMDVQLGEHVGYSVLFEDMTKPGTTFIKFATDNVLLREMMEDNNLERYSTIILDEVQERTVDTDILMSLLKEIAKHRSDLKIVVMSSTRDAGAKFQKFFSRGSELKATLFEVSGRTHSVKVFYTQVPEPDYLEAAVRTVLMIHRQEEPGDILLFLTGEEEIEVACRIIKREADEIINEDPDSVGPLVCIPLHSSLSPGELERIFNPPHVQLRDSAPSGRKIIVATSIAETSFAIDGIVYVVDPGFSKQSIYQPRIGFESLLVSPISKASARQRAGRAGRTRPGKCFRLYTERDFIQELEEENYPEILKCNLGSTVLELLNIGVKDLIHFGYVDAPAPESLMRALELLNIPGAVDDDGNMTSLGRIMAEFPLEPQLSKLLISSPEFKCSNEILTIVAMLSVPSVWIRPSNQRREADAAKQMFTIPESDHLTLLNVYNQYILNKSDKNWAWTNHLSERALAHAENVRSGLQGIMERLDIDLISLSDETKLFLNIRKALVCGFCTQVAHRDKTSYATVKDRQVVELHPSCGLKDQPEWVVFHEFVLTTQPYIRTVTAVRAEWLLEYAPLYFDLKTFPKGEMKRTLQRAQNKQMGKRNVSHQGTSSGAERRKAGKK